MQPSEPMQFRVDGARLVLRNFSGREGPYNREGDRNFLVILEEDAAAAMAADGWNVKRFNPRDDADEGDVGSPYISVTVGYKRRPPKIVMITSTARTNLTEETVGSLDFADIANCDLIAIASHWEMANGKSGIKAYLKTMFVTVNEDELERKYALQEMEEG